MSEKKFVNQICFELTMYASEEVYDCYFVNGNDKHYINLESIMDWGRCDIEELRKYYSEDLVNSIDKFQNVYYQNIDEHLKFQKFLEYDKKEVPSMKYFNNLYWKSIQQAARVCLNELNFDLTQWEEENINWADVGMERPEKYRSKYKKKDKDG